MLLLLKVKNILKYSGLWDIYLGNCLRPWKCEPLSGSLIWCTHWHIGGGSILLKGYYLCVITARWLLWQRHTKVSEVEEIWGIPSIGSVGLIFGSTVTFCLTVPSFWLFFSSAKGVSNSCLLPPRNIVKDLIFCLVIPWDLWMKRTIKIHNVFLGGGFQNWSLWGSHPLGYWIPSLCNVEKAVGENLFFQHHQRKQTSLLFRKWNTPIGDHFIIFFKWMKTSQVEVMKCRRSANRLRPSSSSHKERRSAGSPPCLGRALLGSRTWSVSELQLIMPLLSHQQRIPQTGCFSLCGVGQWFEKESFPGL